MHYYEISRLRKKLMSERLGSKSGTKWLFGNLDKNCDIISILWASNVTTVVRNSLFNHHAFLEILNGGSHL